MNVKNKLNKIKIPTTKKPNMFHIKEIHILKCDWWKLAMFICIYIYVCIYTYIHTYIHTNIIFLLEKCKERNHLGDLDM